MKHTVVVSTIAVMMALLVMPALAQLQAISHPNGDMIIGDQVVLTIQAAGGGMSIQQRVDMVTVRLNKRLGSVAFDRNLITVTKFGEDYAVSYNGDLIATADNETAGLNGTTTKRLANKWAANLRRVIPLAKDNYGHHNK